MTVRESRRNVTLRQATQRDLLALVALLEANALPTAGVAELLSSFVIAESDDEIIGVTGLEPCGPSYALLRSAAVDERWRGQGVGGQLVQQVIASARSRELRALYLLTTTAERYFPSFGFTPVSRDTVPEEVRRTDEFSTACPASATVMVLTLPSSARTPRLGAPAGDESSR